MNKLKVILTPILFFCSIHVYAENKFQVIDRGLDGDQRQYLVTCKDGSRASVTQYFKLPEAEISPERLEKKDSLAGNSVPPKLIKVCIVLENGGEKCQPSWELDSAAKSSCTQ